MGGQLTNDHSLIHSLSQSGTVTIRHTHTQNRVIVAPRTLLIIITKDTNNNHQSLCVAGGHNKWHCECCYLQSTCTRHGLTHTFTTVRARLTLCRHQPHKTLSQSPTNNYSIKPHTDTNHSLNMCMPHLNTNI